MIELRNIKKSFNDNIVLDGLDFTVDRTGIHTVMGESGCGKSTLLNIIALLETPDNGDYLYDNKDISDLSENEKDIIRGNIFGFVFQENNLIEYLNVYDNLNIALMDMDKGQIDNVLRQVGLSGKEKQRVSTLSGGEKQRVAIARALLGGAKIILADEPTGSLDKDNAINVMESIKEISKDVAIIMVTHDKELAAEYSDTVYAITDGKLSKINIKESTDTKIISPPTTLAEKELRLSASLRIAIKTIARTPGRFIRNTLICLFTVFLFSLGVGFLTTGHNKSIESSMLKNGQILSPHNDYNDSSDILVVNHFWYENMKELDDDFFDAKIESIGFIDNTHYNSFDLIIGTYPSNNEILISDYLAASISESTDFDVYKSLIGDSIYSDNNKLTISGIYKTEYEKLSKNFDPYYANAFYETKAHYLSVIFADKSLYTTYESLFNRVSFYDGKGTSFCHGLKYDSEEIITGKDSLDKNEAYVTIQYLTRKFSKYTYTEIENDIIYFYNQLDKNLNLNGYPLTIVGLCAQTKGEQDFLFATDYYKYDSSVYHLSPTKGYDFKHGLPVIRASHYGDLYEPLYVFYGKFLPLVLSVMIIMLVFTFILNYNYFGFTAEENTKTFGILRALGFSKKSILKMLILTAAIFASAILILFLGIALPILLNLQYIYVHAPAMLCLYRINPVMLIISLLTPILLAILAVIPTVKSINKKNILNLKRESFN